MAVQVIDIRDEAQIDLEPMDRGETVAMHVKAPSGQGTVCLHFAPEVIQWLRDTALDEVLDLLADPPVDEDRQRDEQMAAGL